jgi:hypothetical protein
MLFNSKAEVGQGARRRCPVCNQPIDVKPTGRTRTYCSDRCRDVGRRERDFRGSSVPPDTGLASPRNPQKTSTNSVACEGTLADRGSAVKAPIVTVGLGCHAGPHPPERSTERAKLIRTALRLEFAARWGRGIRRTP